MLQVDAEPATPYEPSCFNLQRFGHLATIAIAPDGREHLALSDGQRRIRIDIAHGSLLSGPVLFHHRLVGVAGLDAKLLTLRRLIALCRTGEFARSLHPPDRRAIRVIAALRVHDALNDGASQREIAIALFGADRVATDWPGAGEAIKSRVRRLIALARLLANGGHVRLFGQIDRDNPSLQRPRRR